MDMKRFAMLAVLGGAVALTGCGDDDPACPGGVVGTVGGQTTCVYPGSGTECGPDEIEYTLGGTASLCVPSGTDPSLEELCTSLASVGYVWDAEAGTCTSPGGQTVDIDVTQPDTDTGGSDAGPDTDDGGGGVCDDPCSSNRDCASLGSAFECVEGCCEEGVQLALCTQRGQACSDPSQTTDEYFCDTDAGECLQRCVYEDRFDTETYGGCPLNTFCGAELTGVDELGLTGICLEGDCDTNIFDEEACDGAGTCTPLANGASFCFDAGTAGEGDACGTSTADNPPASDICSPGLLCFANECTQPCNLRNGDDDCTEEGESCLQVIDITQRNQPGICGTDCGAFGTCGEGQFCDVQVGNSGITGWVCVDLADEIAALGESCSGGQQCEEGTICVNQGTTAAPDLQCTEICSPSDPRIGQYAGCSGNGEPIPGAEVIGLTAFGEASDYAVLADDTYEVEVLDGDAGIVQETEVTITAGEIASLVYTFNEGELESFELLDLVADDVLPTTGLRVLHAAPDAGVVDVALVQGDTVSELASGVEYGTVSEGEESAYTTVAAGTYIVRLTLADDSTVDSGEITIEEGTMNTAVAAGSVEGETFGFFAFVDTLPALEDGEGATRLLHMADLAPAVSVNLPSTFANDFACTPSTLDGLGFCNESCTPYPRGGDYGCEDETDSCFPFVAVDDEFVVPGGTCQETTAGADIAPGETCTSTPPDAPDSEFFIFGALCADLAVCFPNSADDEETEGTCLPICEPLSEGQCSDIENGSCRGDLPLQGIWAYSLCTNETQPGSVGDTCDAGEDDPFFCSQDGAMCFTDTAGATRGTCTISCRAGFDDCEPYGLDCATGLFNADIVPSYMGICQ